MILALPSKTIKLILEKYGKELEECESWADVYSLFDDIEKKENLTVARYPPHAYKILVTNILTVRTTVKR